MRIKKSEVIRSTDQIHRHKRLVPTTSDGARRAPERVGMGPTTYEETPYSRIVREVIHSSKIKNLMRRVRRHTGKEEIDQIQDFILTSLELLETYKLTEEEMTSNRFKCLLRRAIQNDLLDELKPFKITLPHGDRLKVRSVSLGDFDPETDYSSEVNDVDGMVTYLPAIPCPEDSYILGNVIRKMLRTVPSSPAAQGALADLIGNADLGESEVTRLKTYVSTHGNFDRVPAKVICDTHGLTKYKRETLLRSAWEYLITEGVCSDGVRVDAAVFNRKRIRVVAGSGRSRTLPKIRSRKRPCNRARSDVADSLQEMTHMKERVAFPPDVDL